MSPPPSCRAAPAPVAVLRWCFLPQLVLAAVAVGAGGGGASAGAAVLGTEVG